MMFWVGFVSGCAIMYVIRDVISARKVKPEEQIYRCAIEVARLDTERVLSTFSDQELVAAIAHGINVTRGDDSARSLHSAVRSGQKSAEGD